MFLGDGFGDNGVKRYKSVDEEPESLNSTKTENAKDFLSPRYCKCILVAYVACSICKSNSLLVTHV